MKLSPRFVLPLLLVAALRGHAADTVVDRNLPEAPDDVTETQPKLIKIIATVDGSGRIVFTRQGVRYEHKTWAKPTNVTFNGEAWTNLNSTPAAWSNSAERLDLTKAWIVKRKGRDTIALESTPDGFDLYLCDAPNGSSLYEVTLAIPQTPGRAKVVTSAPSAKGSSTAQASQTVLNVRRDGSVAWNGRSLGRDELGTRLRELSDLHPDHAVVLRSEDGTAFKEIKAAIEMCRAARIWNVSFTTPRSE